MEVPAIVLAGELKKNIREEQLEESYANSARLLESLPKAENKQQCLEESLECFSILSNLRNLKWERLAASIGEICKSLILEMVRFEYVVQHEDKNRMMEKMQNLTKVYEVEYSRDKHKQSPRCEYYITISTIRDLLELLLTEDFDKSGLFNLIESTGISLEFAVLSFGGSLALHAIIIGVKLGSKFITQNRMASRAAWLMKIEEAKCSLQKGKEIDKNCGFLVDLMKKNLMNSLIGCHCLDALCTVEFPEKSKSDLTKFFNQTLSWNEEVSIYLHDKMIKLSYRMKQNGINVDLCNYIIEGLKNTSKTKRSGCFCSRKTKITLTINNLVKNEWYNYNPEVPTYVSFYERKKTLANKQLEFLESAPQAQARGEELHESTKQALEELNSFLKSSGVATIDGRLQELEKKLGFTLNVHKFIIERGFEDLNSSAPEQDLSNFIPLKCRHEGNGDESSLNGVVQEFIGNSAKTSLLITGYAGSGKTTCLRYLQNEWLTNGLLVLRISLGNLLHLSEGIIEDTLYSWGLRKHHIDILRKESLIVMLDGYDEMGEMTGKPLFSIKGGLIRWPKCKFIIACRAKTYLFQDKSYKELFHPLGKPDSLTEVELCPFSMDQRRELLERYISVFGAKKGWNSRKYEEAIDSVPALSALKGTPFIIITLYEILPDLELSSDIVWTTNSIIQKYIQAYIERNRLKHLERGEVDMTNFIEEVEFYCCCIAEAMLEKKVSEIYYKHNDPGCMDLKDLLDLRKPEIRYKYDSSPLTCNFKNYFSFNSIEILDYFAAELVWKEDSSLKAAKKIVEIGEWELPESAASFLADKLINDKVKRSEYFDSLMQENMSEGSLKQKLSAFISYSQNRYGIGEATKIDIHESEIMSVASNQRGNLVAYSRRTGDLIVRQEKQLCKLRNEGSLLMNSLIFSQLGNFLVAYCEDEQLYCFSNDKNWAEQQVNTEKIDMVLGIDFDDNEKYLFVAASFAESPDSFTVFDLQTMEQVYVFIAEKDILSTVVLSQGFTLKSLIIYQDWSYSILIDFEEKMRKETTLGRNLDIRDWFIASIKQYVKANTSVTNSKLIISTLNSIKEKGVFEDTENELINRPLFVGMQGAFEYILKKALVKGLVKSVVNITHSKQPPTPLCVNFTENCASLIHPGKRNFAQHSMLVTNRSIVIRKLLELVNQFKMLAYYYPPGYQARNETQRAEFDKNVQMLENLEGVCIETDTFDETMSGATYIIDCLDGRKLIYSIKYLQANADQNVIRGGTWFGFYDENSEVRSRFDTIANYFAGLGRRQDFSID